MANDKDFIVKNAVEVGGATKVTLGSSSAGSVSNGYDISAASYDSVSFYLGNQLTAASPTSIAFNETGTKLFILETSGLAYQYSLSTAWDVSTASYDSVSFDPPQSAFPYALEFANSGSKMYIFDYYGTVYEYTLSSAFDLSTASYSSNSYSSSEINGQAQGILFNPNGTKVYLLSANQDAVFQYSLSTAYDISTASYDSKSLDVSSEEGSPYEMSFNNTGTKLFVLGRVNDSVFQYNLSTAYDISTASYSGISFDVSTQEDTPYGLAFKPDGTKMYISGNTNETVYQYSTSATTTTANLDLSTGNYFSHTPTSDLQYTFSNAGDVQTVQVEVTGASAGFGITDLSYDSKSANVSSQIQYAAGVAFKTDGTKMYVTSAGGTGSGDVFQYSLSTAWDVSTASYDSVSYSNGNITYGYGLQFKSDGTRLYIQAYEDDRVYEHTLSTAWDLSTTSATGNSLYYGSQTASAYDFTISSDGTKIYVSNNDSPMYQYTMSTAWDISTASYDSVTFAVSGQTPDDGWYVQFNSDGTKMFGVNADDIYQYSLSTAWDLSTASYDSVSNIGGLSAATDTGNFVFKTDGTKLYQARLGNVYQYTSSSAITITWDADIQWAGGTAPDSPASGEKDLYTITTDDGGTTYIGVQSGDAFS